MKAKNLKFSGLFLAIALMFLTSSCSNDDDDVSNSADLHTIRYEIVAADESDTDIEVWGVYIKITPSKNGGYYLNGDVYAEGDNLTGIITNNTPNIIEHIDETETLPWSYEFKGTSMAGLSVGCFEEKDIICRIYVDGKLVAEENNYRCSIHYIL